MKTLTEIAEKIMDNCQYGASLSDIVDILKSANLQDAVNARDSEPVYQVAMNGTWFDTNLVGYIKQSGVKRTLFTSPQPNQSAYIKRLEDALSLVAKELRMYGYQDESRDFVQSIIRKALASKESIDG
jgi:hypothetical protein